MLLYYRTAASTMYTLKCMVYITALKSKLQFSSLLGPIPQPFFHKTCEWLFQKRLSCTSLNLLLHHVTKMYSTPEIIKLVEQFGEFWRVTSIAITKTILKSVQGLLQNKCLSFDLFIVRMQKSVACGGCLAPVSFFIILCSQKYFL